MPRFFVMDKNGEFYRHLPNLYVSWGERSHANEYQTAQSARYIADKYHGARVVELVGKKICEVP